MNKILLTYLSLALIISCKTQNSKEILDDYHQISKIQKVLAQDSITKRLLNLKAEYLKRGNPKSLAENLKRATQLSQNYDSMNNLITNSFKKQYDINGEIIDIQLSNVDSLKSHPWLKSVHWSTHTIENKLILELLLRKRLIDSTSLLMKDLTKSIEELYFYYSDSNGFVAAIGYNNQFTIKTKTDTFKTDYLGQFYLPEGVKSFSVTDDEYIKDITFNIDESPPLIKSSSKL